ALGPFAEWIAKTLWSIASRTKMNPPATRLTQTRKREAKGIPPNASVIRVILNQKPLINLKPIRLEPHNPIARARRAESQRRQSTAIKAWNPAEKPDWLDEKFYFNKIQPRLLTLQVPAIQSALYTSASYASKIRSGKCIPHPRHWKPLADMTLARR